MTDAEVTPPTYNARIMAQRFLFDTTCDREDMKRYMQLRTQPRRLPTVLSIEEVSEVTAAAPGPGLQYRAALSISYGAGSRASEVCSLKVSDIDSDRMLIHVDEGKGGKDRKVMLSPDLRNRLHNQNPQIAPSNLRGSYPNEISEWSILDSCTQPNSSPDASAWGSCHGDQR